MLSYQELLYEIKRRPQLEQLRLIEEIIHSIRETTTDTVTDQPDTLEQPVDESVDENFVPHTTQEAIALGWPPNYFEETYGSLRGVDFDPRS